MIITILDESLLISEKNRAKLPLSGQIRLLVVVFVDHIARLQASIFPASFRNATKQKCNPKVILISLFSV